MLINFLSPDRMVESKRRIGRSFTLQNYGVIMLSRLDCLVARGLHCRPSLVCAYRSLFAIGELGTGVNTCSASVKL